MKMLRLLNLNLPDDYLVKTCRTIYYERSLSRTEKVKIVI